mmetsp:Transcript_8249/g.12319  ORF Transcript_8249/g.12319 Transcript_8249/m.12319 type:complete len:128 (+) Transcript_8249:108-491(+)
MTTDLRLNPRRKPFPETGSAFDATNMATIKERPGGHHIGSSVDVDVSAFSHSRRTAKPNPSSSLKRGTGLGGTVAVPKITVNAGPDSPPSRKSKSPKRNPHSAFAPRANPPNTELRRSTFTLCYCEY